mgnify:CR=1 FL=1
MNITIREAICADAKKLFELNEKFNGKSDVNIIQIEQSLKDNKQEQVFVAENENEIIGFCCVQIFKSFCYAVNYCEITEIYIEESYQHRGIGSLLVNHIEKHFENTNIKGFQLFTGGENYSAQAFYEKNGYKKTAEIMYRKRI